MEERYYVDDRERIKKGIKIRIGGTLERKRRRNSEIDSPLGGNEGNKRNTKGRDSKCERTQKRIEPCSVTDGLFKTRNGNSKCFY